MLDKNNNPIFSTINDSYGIFINAAQLTKSDNLSQYTFTNGMYSSVAILQTLYKKIDDEWKSTSNVIYYFDEAPKNGMGSVGDIAVRDAILTVAPTFRVGNSKNVKDSQKLNGTLFYDAKNDRIYVHTNRGNYYLVYKYPKNKTHDVSMAISLSQKGNGFFLMIEGSKIDWAGHSRDGATNFREIKDLEESVKLAYDFYRKYPDETLIIVTADHETGGVVLGNGNYSLNLQALQYQTMSGIAFTKEIENLRKQNTEISWETIQKALSHAFGFWSKLDLSPEQEAHLKKIYEETIHNQQGDLIKSLYENNEPIAEAAKTILNEIAEITWSCSSHTAGYVPLYAIGLGAENFQGKLDNTDVPLLIARIAGYE